MIQKELIDGVSDVVDIGLYIIVVFERLFPKQPLKIMSIVPKVVPE